MSNRYFTRVLTASDMTDLLSGVLACMGDGSNKQRQVQKSTIDRDQLMLKYNEIPSCVVYGFDFWPLVAEDSCL